MTTPDERKAEEQAFCQGVEASRQRMEHWPEWKRQAAAAMRVSEPKPVDPSAPKTDR